MTASQGGYYVMPYGKNVTTYNYDFAYAANPNVELKSISKRDLDNISEIYPNPTTNHATVLVNNPADLFYRIINLKGQVQQSGKIMKKTSTLQLNLSEIKAGNYWIIFTDGNFSVSRSLIIVR